MGAREDYSKMKTFRDGHGDVLRVIKWEQGTVTFHIQAWNGVVELDPEDIEELINYLSGADK